MRSHPSRLSLGTLSFRARWRAVFLSQRLTYISSYIVANSLGRERPGGIRLYVLCMWTELESEILCRRCIHLCIHGSRSDHSRSRSTCEKLVTC